MDAGEGNVAVTLGACTLGADRGSVFVRMRQVAPDDKPLLVFAGRVPLPAEFAPVVLLTGVAHRLRFLSQFPNPTTGALTLRQWLGPAGGPVPAPPVRVPAERYATDKKKDTKIAEIFMSYPVGAAAEWLAAVRLPCAHVSRLRDQTELLEHVDTTLRDAYSSASWLAAMPVKDRSVIAGAMWAYMQEHGIIATYAWWLARWYGPVDALVNDGDLLERLAWLPPAWRVEVWGKLDAANVRIPLAHRLAESMAGDLRRARHGELRTATIAFAGWVNATTSKVCLPGFRNGESLVRITLDDDKQDDDTNNGPLVTARRATTVADELAGTAGHDTAVEVTTGRPMTSIVLTAMMAREPTASVHADHYRVGLDNSPGLARIAVHVLGRADIALATIDRLETCGRPEAWTHVVVLGAHRLTTDAWRRLRLLIGQMRRLNGIDPRHDGSLTVVGCPVFEFADVIGGSRFRQLLGTPIAGMPDLAGPPDDRTVQALTHALADAIARGRITVAKHPNHPPGDHVFGREEVQCILSKDAAATPPSITAEDECRMDVRKDARGAHLLCPPLAYYMRWRTAEAIASGSSLLAWHPRPMLAPRLLVRAWKRRQRPTTVCMTERALNLLFRDELLFLIVALAENDGWLTLVLKTDAPRATPAPFLKVLANRWLRPTRHWTAVD